MYLQLQSYSFRFSIVERSSFSPHGLLLVIRHQRISTLMHVVSRRPDFLQRKDAL